jgi:hypothetical protein
VSVGTIRSRLSRGREMLRQLMGISNVDDAPAPVREPRKLTAGRGAAAETGRPSRPAAAAPNLGPANLASSSNLGVTTQDALRE